MSAPSQSTSQLETLGVASAELSHERDADSMGPVLAGFVGGVIVASIGVLLWRSAAKLDLSSRWGSTLPTPHSSEQPRLSHMRR
jgi:hypothetical protein